MQKRKKKTIIKRALLNVINSCINYAKLGSVLLIDNRKQKDRNIEIRNR